MGTNRTIGAGPKTPKSCWSKYLPILWHIQHGRKRGLLLILLIFLSLSLPKEVNLPQRDSVSATSSLKEKDLCHVTVFQLQKTDRLYAWKKEFISLVKWSSFFWQNVGEWPLQNQLFFMFSVKHVDFITKKKLSRGRFSEYEQKHAWKYLPYYKTV